MTLVIAAKSSPRSATSGVTWGPAAHKSLLHGTSKNIVDPGVPWKGTMTTAQFPDPNAGAAELAPAYTQTYGFEFHYNPQQITIDTQMDDSVDSQNNTLFDPNLWVHQQSIQFTLLLNRQPDMLESTGSNFAGVGGMSSTNLSNIKKYGTLVDLDYIFKTCNGDFTAQDAPNSINGADIGFIYYAPVLVTFSPYWSVIGMIQDIAVTHQQFTTKMVPVLTQVQISMVRQSAAQPGPVSDSGGTGGPSPGGDQGGPARAADRDAAAAAAAAAQQAANNAFNNLTKTKPNPLAPPPGQTRRGGGSKAKPKPKQGPGLNGDKPPPAQFDPLNPPTTLAPGIALKPPAPPPAN